MLHKRQYTILPRCFSYQCICPSIRCRSLPNDHVERLQADLTPQEIASADQTAFISDLVDIDRTSELLLWIMSMWRRDKGEERAGTSIARPSKDKTISIISIIDAHESK
jgi:hypothetical protein